MIDWDAPDPKPDFTPPQNVVEIRTLADALKLLDDWEAAYAELEHRYAIKHRALINALFWAEYYDGLASNYCALYEAALKPENDDIRDMLSSILRQA